MPLPVLQFPILTALLCGVGFFLSLWIVIPAPVFALLPLSVGAPEVSLWLVGLNAAALLLSGQRQRYWLLAGSAVALLLSLLPLSQFPAANQQAAIALQTVTGADFLAAAPQWVQSPMRPRPLVWSDALRGISVPTVRQIRDVEFASPDGVPLHMNIYQPQQSGQYPAIVMIYGGAWQAGSPADNADFGCYMAAQGYVVWAIDYRHAPAYRFPAQLDDVQTALRFIRDHAAEYRTDVSRLALMGRSAGAQLAMLAAYQPEAPPIRAVVSYYGPVDLTAGYFDPPRPDPIDTRSVLRAFLGGTPTELPDRYRQASPYQYVTRSLPPTLLIYGKRDHIVQSKFGRQLYERLQENGSPAVFIEIPWAEHAFDAVFGGISNQLALYYTERFLAWALQ